MPGELPAKVMVAPNSPRARAQHSTVPAASDGAIRGSVTLRKVASRDAPKVEAASSKPRSRPRKAPSTVTTRNGIATKHCARTTPSVVKGRVNPNHSSSQRPTTPRRPNARSSATPPTTGGSTRGRVTRALSSDRPRKWVRARTQASGTPSTTATAVELVAVTRDSRRASSTAGSRRMSGRLLQGVRSSMAARGTRRKVTPTAAGTASGHGAVSRRMGCRAERFTGWRTLLTRAPRLPPRRGRARRRRGQRRGSPTPSAW